MRVKNRLKPFSACRLQELASGASLNTARRTINDIKIEQDLSYQTTDQKQSQIRARRQVQWEKRGVVIA